MGNMMLFTMDSYDRKEKKMSEEPFCCRCKEDFRTGEEEGIFRMGELQKLKYAPKTIRDQFREWLNSEIHGEGYLCGNCYFDLTD